MPMRGSATGRLQFVALVVAAFLALATAGCGSSGSEQNGSPGASSSAGGVGY
jgi:hypothetical protein